MGRFIEVGNNKKFQFVLDFIQWSTPGRMDAWNKAASTVLYSDQTVIVQVTSYCAVDVVSSRLRAPASRVIFIIIVGILDLPFLSHLQFFLSHLGRHAKANDRFQRPRL